MRIGSLNTISLAVLVVAYAFVRAVPTLHEAARASLRRGAEDTSFVALAEQRPNDEAAWLTACRAVPATGQVPPADLQRAYFRAAALAPMSAAPHWFYATQLVRGIPFERTEKDAIYDLEPTPGSQESVQLDFRQKAALRKADAALQRAMKLDPTNAAVDYLRAYLALADHRDGTAMVLLRSGLGKQKWDQYGRTAAIAAFETLRRVLPASEASAFADHLASDPSANLMEMKLARVLAGMSILEARGGGDARAIFLRESVDHMGRLMIGNAYQVNDAVAGVSAWIFGSTWDPKEPLPADARDPSSPRDEIYPGAGIAVYLREHGRPDLAEEYASFGKLVRPTYEQLTRTRDVRDREQRRDANLSTILGHLSVAQVLTLALLVLCGIVALLLRAFRRPVQPIEWPAWGWLLVVAASLAAVFAVGLIWAGESPIRKAFREIVAQMDLDPRAFRPRLGERPWGYYFVIVGLPAILVSAFTAVLVHRRRSADRRAGLTGHYLGTLLCVVLPLAALFSLSVLILAVPAAQRAKTRSAMNQAVIYRGEIAYYGLKLP